MTCRPSLTNIERELIRRRLVPIGCTLSFDEDNLFKHKFDHISITGKRHRVSIRYSDFAEVKLIRKTRNNRYMRCNVVCVQLLKKEGDTFFQKEKKFVVMKTSMKSVTGTIAAYLTDEALWR